MRTAGEAQQTPTADTCSRVAAILILALVSPAAGKYGGGSGTPDDPYQIWTPEQMDAIGADPNDWNRHFKLMANIDLSAYPNDSFHPIGSRWGPGGIRPFQGTFDGNGHSITGFHYSSEEPYPKGLFIYVSAPGASVRNLRLVSPRVNAPKASEVGALIGSLGQGTVADCSATDVVVRGNAVAGGLVGRTSGALVNCSCGGEVTSEGSTGGLAGSAGGSIIECQFEGIVTGKRLSGGLVEVSGADRAQCAPNRGVCRHRPCRRPEKCRRSNRPQCRLDRGMQRRRRGRRPVLRRRTGRLERQRDRLLILHCGCDGR